VSGALRQTILDDWDLDEEVVDTLLQRAVSREVQATAYAAADIPKSMQLVDTLDENDQISPEIMLQTLQDVEIALFLAMFSKFTKLEGEFTKRLLFEPSGDRLAIVCKASGIGKAVFSSLFALTRLATPAEAELQAEIGRSLALYDKTSRSQAMDIARRWQGSAQNAKWTKN
jgi:uncharacterized protein (DUF2336 family)